MTETTTEPQGSQLPATRETGLAVLPPRLDDESNRDHLVRLMEMLPQPPADVVDKIIGQILGAQSMAEANRLWDAMGSKDAAGREFIFHSAHLQPSDYDDSVLPYYLVCDVTDLETGERTVLTTGSTNIVTDLVRAQVLGQLPWQARIVAPPRIPKSGRIPLRLQWIAKVLDPGEDR